MLEEGGKIKKSNGPKEILTETVQATVLSP